MPRKPREEMEGAVHHVYARGNRKQLVFLDDDDRAAYLRLLAKAVGRYGWRCLSYCLMDNHVHLLIETPRPNLGIGVQWLHGHYARAFNDRHDRSGHLFQGRYGAVRMLDDVHLWVATRYVARNPVEAAECAQPQDWPWSSHGSIAAGDAPPWLDVSRLLSYFESVGGDPRERYLELVASA